MNAQTQQVLTTKSTWTSRLCQTLGKIVAGRGLQTRPPIEQRLCKCHQPAAGEGAPWWLQWLLPVFFCIASTHFWTVSLSRAAGCI